MTVDNSGVIKQLLHECLVNSQIAALCLGLQATSSIGSTIEMASQIFWETVEVASLLPWAWAHISSIIYWAKVKMTSQIYWATVEMAFPLPWATQPRVFFVLFFLNLFWMLTKHQWSKCTLSFSVFLETSICRFCFFLWIQFNEQNPVRLGLLFYLALLCDSWLSTTNSFHRLQLMFLLMHFSFSLNLYPTLFFSFIVLHM